MVPGDRGGSRLLENTEGSNESTLTKGSGRETRRGKGKREKRDGDSTGEKRGIRSGHLTILSEARQFPKTYQHSRTFYRNGPAGRQSPTPPTPPILLCDFWDLVFCVFIIDAI